MSIKLTQAILFGALLLTFVQLTYQTRQWQPQMIYGCKYDLNLCTSYQTCAEDKLFGVCQSIFDSRAVYKYETTKPLRYILEYSLRSLLDLGYKWHHLYTQCIIGGVLESYKHHITPDLQYCDVKETHEHKVLQPDISPYLQYKPLPNLSNGQIETLLNYFTENNEAESPAQPIQDQQTTTGDRNVTGSGIDTSVKLSDSEQKVLDQLIDGTLSVNQLSTSQIKLIKAYLQTVLKPVMDQNDELFQTTPDGTQQTNELKDSRSDDMVLRMISNAVSARENSESQDKSAEIVEIEQLAELFNKQRRKDTSSSEEHSVNPGEDDLIGQEISDRVEQLQADKRHGEPVNENEGTILDSAPTPPQPITMSGQTLIQNTEIVDTSTVFVKFNTSIDMNTALSLTDLISENLPLPSSSINDIRRDGSIIYITTTPNSPINSTQLAKQIMGLQNDVEEKFHIKILSTGIGHDKATIQISPLDTQRPNDSLTVLIVAIVICICIIAVISLITWRCMYKRWAKSVSMYDQIATDGSQYSQDSYEDLCRQTAGKVVEETRENDSVPPLREHEGSTERHQQVRSPRSSTSSWSEEPPVLSLDVSTGHTILTYMEDHLTNSQRLEEEWNGLVSYVPDCSDCSDAQLNENKNKNRNHDVLPYNHTRVKLSTENSQSDYINASFIADDDPRDPPYIATQGPFQYTTEDFWRMIWEQQCSSIVMLTTLSEDNKTLCYQYWPSQGKHNFGEFEVHLVSEHLWSDDNIVRSLFLKNLQTNQTRTVTQFHYLTWYQNTRPNNTRDILDFRRKVKKSYKGKSCPTVVMCSDGAGLSGTYILLDMVITRLHKGVKEVDIAATLEHLRDQRMGLVNTREQFEFVLQAVADEVQSLLKTMK